MLTIHLITLGKLKESYWREAETEYLKRLKPHAKMIIHELKEESFSEKDSPEFIKQKEAVKIQAELDTIKNSFIIGLDERGKSYSSTAFTKHLTTLMNSNSSFTFILGGPLGLDTSILQKTNLQLSLSSFTFTHQMARILLIEQLYRAMMIQHNRPYHY